VNAALICAAVAVLVPGVSYATASSSSQSTQALAVTQCRGIIPVVFPAKGFVTDPARNQGGHLWWRRTADGGVCLGTVVEWVQYNVTTTKTWRVIIYSAQHPGGQVVASRTFTLARGWYFWGFRIREVFPGLSAVCLTADGSYGTSCVRLGG
jgi:hypothetical protein